MYQVGITGNIGAGKSTVAKLFLSFGIPCYDADTRAKWLMTNNTVLKQSLIDAFGAETYFKDGSLNRAYLGNIVFKDKAKLETLNSLVHGLVFEDSKSWALQQKSKYVLREAALLIESGHYKHLDKLVLVVAPTEIRLNRVLKRDALTKKAIQERMDNQMPESDKRDFADFIIENDGKKSLIEQCWALNKQIIQEIESSKNLDR